MLAFMGGMFLGALFISAMWSICSDADEEDDDYDFY